MLELRRNINEVCVMKCDESGESILPWDWYWYDSERNLNFTIPVVNEWKEKAMKEFYADVTQEAKEYENWLKQIKNEKKSLALEAKQSFIEEYSKQLES